jgi:hypothetical protein
MTRLQAVRLKESMSGVIAHDTHRTGSQMRSVPGLDGLEEKQILFPCRKSGNETVISQLNIPQRSKTDIVQCMIFRNVM